VEAERKLCDLSDTGVQVPSKTTGAAGMDTIKLDTGISSSMSMLKDSIHTWIGASHSIAVAMAMVDWEGGYWKSRRVEVTPLWQVGE
jgi:hypothetical protein